MSNLTFPDFTLSAPPSLTDYIVGYATAIAGGERRTTLQSVSDLLGTGYFGGLTANRLLLGQANGTLASSDLTYSTPTLTVPDAFNISSAGAISLTAGGSNKPVRLIPSGTAGLGIANGTGLNNTLVEVVQTGASTPISAWIGNPSIATFLGETTAGTADMSLGFAAGSTGGNRASFSFRKSRGTLAVPTTVSQGDIVGGFGFGAFDGTNFLNSAFLQGVVDSQLSVTTGVAGQRIGFFMGVTGTGTRTETVAVRMNGTLTPGFSSKTIAAWGISGAHLAVGGNTVTDNSSPTGTVASAVFNSFGVPTINATNPSVVYTNLANVYIAGDVATTGNASATNSYGLWNVGKTRLDGRTGIGVGASATSVLSLAASTTAISSLNIPHGAAPTSPVNGDMWTTTAGLFIRINGATVGPLS